MEFWRLSKPGTSPLQMETGVNVAEKYCNTTRTAHDNLIAGHWGSIESQFLDK